MRSALLLAAALFSIVALAAPQVVIPGKPAKKTAAKFEEGKVVLYGPVKLPKELRDADGPLTLRLEGVAFDPKKGNSATLYLVNADAKAKTVTVDPANYVGSAANVFGMQSKGVEIIREVNDFSTDGKEFKPRTNLKAMDQAYLALVLMDGSVTFKKAVLTTGPAPAVETTKDAGR